MAESQREQRTVLVIDDSEIVLEMTRFTLESAGYRVVTRNRASGSIAVILKEQPALVLLDVNMPGASGESIADVLVRSAPARDTLIVLYSSLPLNALRMKALATGAHGFIQKTTVQNELIRQVNAFVRQSESNSKLRAAQVQSVPPPNGSSSARIRAALPVEDTRRSSAQIRAAMAVDDRLRVDAPPPSDPAWSDNPSSPSAPPPRRNSGTLTLTIPSALFVDDDMAILSGYRRAFSSDELVPEFLTSAEQALRRLASPSTPDVVVTDLVLPGMNGIELYRRALELDPTWRHRFVFVTGAPTLGYVAEFLREVGGRALAKPVDTRRLRDAIRYSATGARIFRKQTSQG